MEDSTEGMFLFIPQSFLFVQFPLDQSGLGCSDMKEFGYVSELFETNRQLSETGAATGKINHFNYVIIPKIFSGLHDFIKILIKRPVKIMSYRVCYN